MVIAGYRRRDVFMTRARFSEAELVAIQEAVARAESQTGGEIVVYAVGECDPYPEARWRGAACGALLGLIVGLVLHWWQALWGADLVLWSMLPALLGMLAGLLLVDRWSWLRRRLASRAALERRVALRAASAFLEESVFATRERTGILIFLALFEHRAVILGDEGINARVEPGEWEKIVEQLLYGIRSGKGAAAVEECVLRCGRLLAERRVERAPDDRDELPDRPRIRET
jgi:putative membrane protein